MKRVVVLGSTGSIGTQTLDIVAQHRDDLEVVGLAANRNATALEALAARHGVSRLALFSGLAGNRIPSGMQALVDMVTAPDVDVVVVAVAGVIGLLPTLAAIEAGKQIALASKEVLVAAGDLVMKRARAKGVTITPIDSEHSALFQCLQGYRPDQVDSLVLTASGGPFRGRRKEDLRQISVDQALCHPTWRMGGKITIDSATLMNKGLETIEARWLFDIDVDRVQVVVHPQSVVHSMVRYKDGSVLGQLGWPDMRLPIAYALLYPERKPNSLRPWNPVETPCLTFEPVDEETFGCLQLARRAARTGGTLPCALNAANEEAANAFLQGEIPFLRIAEVVEEAMAAHRPVEASLEAVLETDTEARAYAREAVAKRPVAS